mgnify:CR=1 FL=1
MTEDSFGGVGISGLAAGDGVFKYESGFGITAPVVVYTDVTIVVTDGHYVLTESNPDCAPVLICRRTKHTEVMSVPTIVLGQRAEGPILTFRAHLTAFSGTDCVRKDILILTTDATTMLELSSDKTTLQVLKLEKVLDNDSSMSADMVRAFLKHNPIS